MVMKIDEKEFRSFIADLRIVLSNGTYNDSLDTPIDEGSYFISENRAMNKLIDFEKMLETSKPSKWKQLKLINDGDTHIEKI